MIEAEEDEPRLGVTFTNGRSDLSEKMRVHILAKELNVPSKTIIEKCQAEGIGSVKNHMSTLSAGLHATILEWFSEGTHDVAVETSNRVDLDKVRLKVLPKSEGGFEDGDEGAESGVATETIEPDEIDIPGIKAAPVAGEIPPSRKEVHSAPSLHVEIPPPAVPVTEHAPRVEIPAATPDRVEPEPARVAAQAAPLAPSVETPKTAPRVVVPAGPQHVPAPAKLSGPRVVRYEAPDRDLPPIRRPIREREATYETDRPPLAGKTGPVKPGEKDARKAGARVNPRRAAGRVAEAGERLAEWRDKDLAERAQRLEGATGRRMFRRRSSGGGGGHSAAHATGPKTLAMVHEPIRMKEFCSETGLSFMQLFKVMRDEHKLLPNINMILPPETAQLLALQFGIELQVVPAKTMLDDLQEQFAQRERNTLMPRPPVVTVLGHVDHGKTSLLDAIRKARVAAGEDGGITQAISSYYLETSHGAVTFLDTPGHEAFAAMRARGAKMTDVVVLVVAANDGVMPQTIEAIRHAQAAKVPIVIALNKIDLGEQNKLKIYGQLSEQQLAPSEWGGEVDVIPTSATTGVGVAELVQHLADLSSVLELKADPTIPAIGTVIEAETKVGVGPVIRVLVQEGTLRVGDYVVCGNAAGKIRAVLNDRGARIKEATPSMPVEVWGLDDVPTAGDRLYQVESLQRAKEIAVETKQLRLDNSRIQTRRMRSLAEMLKRRDFNVVPELNIVIKADVDGSVAALKQALGEIPSDEVKLAIRHAAVGPVNDSDILLAEACEGIVVSFRVDPSAGAKRLAEQHGVDVRSYRVIYEVCDDIKKALEGLLAPDEHIETRATMEVREVFRLSKRAGVVAGCYVTSGLADRGHQVKLLRDGKVVRDGSRIASLRRFKDDVKEVRAGMECGLRIDGFDDIHAGDVVETYEVIQTARTL